MNRFISALLLFLIAGAGLAGAQPAFNVSVGPGIDSLQPAGEVSNTQGSVAAAGDVEYLFAAERARLFYDVGLSTYATPGDWLTVIHDFGGRYRFDLGSTRQHHLFAGSTVVLRRNGDSWEAADYNALGGYANLELHPSATSAIRTGYRVDVRRFPTYDALDQLEQTAFGSVLVNFATRTTLIGEVTLGAKHYEGLPSTTMLTSVPTNGTDGASTGAGDNRNGAARGNGVHAGSMSSLVFTPMTVPGSPSTDARHATVFVRLAQSIASRTGLSGEFSRRLVFGDVPPAVIATPARFFDDGVYDDPYASDATVARLALRSFVGSDVEVTMFGSWQDKPYEATPAFDGNGAAIPNELRHDRVWRAGAVASWPIAASGTGPFDVDFVCGYDFTRHQSTTAAYNYVSHTVTVGVALAY